MEDRLHLGDVLLEYLEEYNVEFPSQMHLVFFADAVAHVRYWVYSTAPNVLNVSLCRLAPLQLGKASGGAGSSKHALLVIVYLSLKETKPCAG